MCTSYVSCCHVCTVKPTARPCNGLNPQTGTGADWLLPQTPNRLTGQCATEHTQDSVLLEHSVPLVDTGQRAASNTDRNLPRKQADRTEASPAIAVKRRCVGDAHAGCPGQT
jgi:hypothetical protein